MMQVGLVTGRRRIELREFGEPVPAPGKAVVQELPLQALLEVLPGHCPLSLEVRSRYYREAFPDPAARAMALRRRTVEFLDSVAQR
jgi:hypothetical protein